MTSGPANILIVDDDSTLQETLVDFLEPEGYATFSALNVAEARKRIAANDINLILLDLNMPGGDGLTFAAELRAKSSVPIIMMSGKGEMIDRVVGLEVGADDYLPKPFELRELLARVRALLRRSSISAPSDATEPGGSASATAAIGAAFIYQPDERRLVTTDDQIVEMTGAEYQLLTLFIDRPGRVLTRVFIADCVQGGDSDTFDRSIDTLVSRLRKKLAAHGADDIIQTVRGEGYVFAAAVNWTGPKPKL